MSSDPTGTNIEGEAPDAGPVVETDEATITEDAELERTLGLPGGLAIGIGTMIGAGIFVFPGLAGAEVGTAATASFAVGGLVALLVALPTSELATAMPKSGGGYYFISRGLGTLAGTVIGLSLWLGLVFATAFYLVGLGFYALDALSQVGVTVGAGPGLVVSAIAVLAGVAFTVLNVTGPRTRPSSRTGSSPCSCRCWSPFSPSGCSMRWGSSTRGRRRERHRTCGLRSRSCRSLRSCSPRIWGSRRSRPSPGR